MSGRGVPPGSALAFGQGGARQGGVVERRGAEDQPQTFDLGANRSFALPFQSLSYRVRHASSDAPASSPLTC